MTTCPHCQETIELRTLPHHGLFESYRTCPTCEGTFDVDPKTKRMQAVWLAVLLVSLALTILLYLRGIEWLVPASVSYLMLGALLYWGNRRMYLVPANPKNQR